MSHDRAAPSPSFTRIAAGLAAACTLVGASLVGAAVVGTRRLWFGGYVSEAGVASEAQAPTYRFGILALAAGLVLLSVAVWRVAPLAAGLLVGGALFAAVSGSVPCSEGCPLPPYESATAADLVHAGASVLAVGGGALAMLVLAFGPAKSSLWRLSRVSAWIVVPLIAAAAVAMLALGKGPVTGLFERAALVSATGWTCAAAVQLSLRGRTEPARYKAR